MGKTLYKSSRNRKICGVCGGIGEYFGIDPTVIRILWIISLFVLGTGFLLYLVFALIMPKERY